jgi:hypothetical protein
LLTFKKKLHLSFFEVIQMQELYAGVDIHKENYVGCIVDTQARIVRETHFPPTKEGIQSFICGMGPAENNK